MSRFALQALAERVWAAQQQRRLQPQSDAFDALAGARS
jgi:hypothetical protein